MCEGVGGYVRVWEGVWCHTVGRVAKVVETVFRFDMNLRRVGAQNLIATAKSVRVQVQGSGFRVQGSGFGVQGSGFRVQG